ncbi:MAG TPA: serine/threonine-protein kinase, partial [Polyangiales bacterium]|nr:serine/threonine-protein kinase [Polyangiales bacterium]
MAVSNALPESSPQRVADRYLIVAELGAGGVGKVFEAIDESTGRRVALKQLHASAREQAEFVTLFKREYYTLKQLSHPVFVEVHEYGVDSAGPFFTMELLAGRDLAKCGALPWRETCRVLRDVASGLAVLHSRGLVYRDLSARNVRLSADGQAKLFDFGAMASRDVAQSKVVGTPPFVAPEALHGQPLDARTDLYALGALGYYMLTASHAYPAHRFDRLRDCWRTAPRPPSALGAESPPALDELLLSLLSIDPRARPPHAAEVIDRLSALADLSPLPAALEAHAYLNRPTLVARGRETLAMRKQLLRMLRGRGGASCIEAAAGMGRTRLLEELALEAKLMGALVLHAQSRSGGQRYDTIRQLCSQLFATLPELALETALPFLPELRTIVPELAEQRTAEDPLAGDVASVDADERWARAQVALVGWLDAVSRRRPLVIAVDDLQLCDDASSAVIAGLALC